MRRRLCHALCLILLLILCVVHNSRAQSLLGSTSLGEEGRFGGRSSLLQAWRPRTLNTLLSSLYGGNGISLAVASGHAPHFTVSSTAAINQLNKQIASEIGVFPFTSSQGGFTYAFDAKQGTFARTT